MPRIRPPISRRKVRIQNALRFHERYVQAFEDARRTANAHAEDRALRKAQYWLDRWRLFSHADDEAFEEMVSRMEIRVDAMDDPVERIVAEQ